MSSYIEEHGGLLRKLAELGLIKAPPGETLAVDELLEAIGTAMEELTVAEEELDRQREELDRSHSALDRQRRHFGDLFEVAPDAFLVTDPFGTIESANQAAAELLGVPPPFLRRKPLTVFVPIEQRPDFRARLSDLAASLAVEDCETPLHRRDGTTIHASARVAVIRDSHGRPSGLIWSIRDVTGQKRAEGLLREMASELERRVGDRTAELETEHRSREQLLLEAHSASVGMGEAGRPIESIVHDLDGIIWAADAATGRFTFVSRGAEAILGLPPSRWIDEPDFFASRIHPEDREYVLDSHGRVLGRGGPHEIEYRMLAADGRAVWFRESVRAVSDETGAPLELRGLMVNISRRKKAERQLYTSRRELADDLRDMTHLHELSTRLAASLELPTLLEEVLNAVLGVQGAEAGALRLLDRERGELSVAASFGMDEGVLRQYNRVPAHGGLPGVAADSREMVVVEDTQADPAPGDYVADLLRAGYRAVCCIPLLAGSGETIGTITTCFREPHRPSERQDHLVRLYARLAGLLIEGARSIQEAREADRRKETFLATLSHEMRNPLASLRAAADLLRRPDLDEPAQDHARDVIDRQVEQLTRLVNDLLDTSRVALGKLALQVEPVDLAGAVARAADSVRPLIEARGHELSVSLPPHPPRVEADPARLEQILVNLLTNAAKYTDPGGRIALSVERDGREVVFRVQDNGIGIAAEVLPRIFSLYEQGPPSEGSQGGLGIGLSLVRSLVEMHGGRISAFSAGPGRGSEFIVHLPAAPGPSGGDNGQGPTPGADAPARPRDVLLVDDHVDTATLLSRWLGHEGHRVTVAHDGPAALDALGPGPPDLAMIDLALPGMDGFALADRLRERSPGTKLIALTGFADPARRDRALAAGFDDYLVKPVDLDALRRLLGAL